MKTSEESILQNLHRAAATGQTGALLPQQSKKAGKVLYTRLRMRRINATNPMHDAKANSPELRRVKNKFLSPGSSTGKNNCMNVKRLTRQTVISIAAIAACALVPPTVASLKNPVTRPLRNSGNLILMVNPDTGVYQFSDWGQATHAGRYSDSASGVMNLATGQFISGHGTIVAANGDTIDWMIGAPNEVVYTGGTGRFQGVTGGFPAVITSVTPLDITSDTWTFGLTYTGSGEITY